ncbi:hypothetical protein IWX90DRAFT_192159 [Phyllosticta citrichinensis]|uniref:Uncharacterized protein n=1 Tax=Phyllosticta citrichinensis TaxID=1130410 RepID=A0ABR1XWU4_9PEZI
MLQPSNGQLTLFATSSCQGTLRVVETCTALTVGTSSCRRRCAAPHRTAPHRSNPPSAPRGHNKSCPLLWLQDPESLSTRQPIIDTSQCSTSCSATISAKQPRRRPAAPISAAIPLQYQPVAPNTQCTLPRAPRPLAVALQTRPSGPPNFGRPPSMTYHLRAHSPSNSVPWLRIPDDLSPSHITTSLASPPPDNLPRLLRAPRAWRAFDACNSPENWLLSNGNSSRSFFSCFRLPPRPGL